MPLREEREYLDKVVSYVRFPPDRAAVRRELADHLWDKRKDLEAQGWAFQAATQKAIEEMGDAAVIGKRLNKEHNPFIGWLWWLSRAVLLLTAGIAGFTFLTSINWGDGARSWNPPDGEALLYKAEVDKTIHIDSRILHVESLCMDINRTAHIVYTDSYDRPFESGWDSIFPLFHIKDDLGNVYVEYGMTDDGKEIVLHVDKIEPEAESLYLIFERYDRHAAIEIPVPKESAYA